MSPLDAMPFGWHFALDAIGSGLLFLAPFLIASYLASDTHARRRARVQRMTARRRSTADTDEHDRRGISRAYAPNRLERNIRR